MLVGAIMLCGFLLSCSKGDEGEKVVQNPLAGTLWEEDDDAPLRIEFIDNSTVAVWGSYQARDYGTYRVSGNKVTFSSLSTDSGYYEYLSGTFTSNTLIVNYNIGSLSGYKCYLYKK